MQHVYGQRVA